MLDERITPNNQQGLDIRPTPREEMNLYPMDTFAYEYVGKEIWVDFTIPEFTAICPFSDFPDFAVIKLKYVPNERCIELKSLKLYINSFREVKIFHEHVINLILEVVSPFISKKYNPFCNPEKSSFSISFPVNIF